MIFLFFGGEFNSESSNPLFSLGLHFADPKISSFLTDHGTNQTFFLNQQVPVPIKHQYCQPCFYQIVTDKPSPAEDIYPCIDEKLQATQLY